MYPIWGQITISGLMLDENDLIRHSKVLNCGYLNIQCNNSGLNEPNMGYRIERILDIIVSKIGPANDLKDY